MKIFTHHVYDSICNESAIKLLKSTIRTLAIVIVSLTIYSIIPVVALLQNNEIQLTVPVLFPFTNLESQTGLIVNMLNQLFIAAIGMTANIGIEVLNCILANTVWTNAIVICYSIDEISRILQNSKQHSVGIVDYRFRNIVMRVQDADRY